MEKNKGIFPFRKHPVGELPDGKKERKQKDGRLRGADAWEMRRALGMLLAAAVLFNALPFGSVAASESSADGLCEHHPEHTAECGYAEAQPCTHEHGEECYKTVTECVHEHTDECYPETEATEESTGEGSATTSDAGNREPSLCTHVCNEESGCITKVLDCHHEHDENCGYQEAQDCGYVCEICNGTEPENTENNAENDAENAGTDTAECICETVCTEDSINGDCPVCGADDASLLDCKGKVSEENTENQEDTGICKHHQEHDADCGYIPKSEDGEGSPCTYECRICPIEDLIAALPDKVTKDNAEEVRAQLDEILALYRELNEDEQEQIDLSRCYELQEALDNANAPVQAAEEITINNTTVKTLTAEDGDCPGHTFTGTAQRTTIYVASGVHNVTFSNLSITESANVGIAPGATMNLTIEGTNTIQAGSNFAGIYVPAGAALVIQGAGSLDVSGDGSAGIGGAAFVPDEYSSAGDPNCGTVEIKGGTVTATGGRMCAGIGGGVSADYSPGNGGTVTISGGTVTAAGNANKAGHGGAGIGGSAGETTTSRAGSGGSLTISGGHVTLTAGNSTSYGFGQGTGKAPGGTCELTLTDASYLDSSTTLDPNGKYTINGDPTEDMIVVPELVYTGEVLDTSGIKIDDSKTGTGTYFNQTFTVNASADGWVLQELGEVKEAKEYTATFKKGDKEISKKFTVAKSGTDLTDGKVKTYNGDTQTTAFNADDTITVKATPVATGTAPAKAAARLWGDYTAPTAGQMALFVGDVQVSEPVQAGEGGTYTMTVSAAEVLLKGNAEPNGNAVTLTAKFVGNDNMADGTGTATVNITAVAKAELDGKVIGYYGESNLDSAFAAENTGATVTLLKDVDLGENDLMLLSGTFTLDCGAFTLSSSSEYFVIKLDNADLTFAGGTIQYNGTGNAVLCATGAFTMMGGTLNAASDYALNCAYGGEANIQGGTVGTQGKGLCIGNPDRVELSGGTYATICIVGNYGAQKVPLSTILADGRAAYGPDGPITRDTVDAELTGPIIVKECEHDGVKPTSNSDGTHALKCPYCGYSEAAANCTYVFSGTTGTCAECGDSVTVAVATDNLIYDGTEKTPGVTVTRGETVLTAGNYSVAYTDNTNAGTATVTVTIGNEQGSYTENFNIGKATPTITWSSTSQELTYTGQQAVITAPTVTLVNSENFSGTISYSYKKEGETDYKYGLPTDAGTYAIKAHVDAEGNYNATDSTDELTLTIKKADAEITVGTAAYDVNYGGPAFTISGVTDTNPETAVQYAVTEGTDVISVLNGTVTIKNAGTATITVSLPETANYNAAANKTITVTVAKKGGYTECEINKKYYYDRENTAEINLASLLPRDCGTVTYGEPVITSGNMTFTAKAVENGVLSYTLAKGNVNDAGTITVTVTTRNYEDITVTVKAVLTDQILVELKEGTEVTLANTILTYGESLSGLGFNNAVFVDGDGKTVEGILAWKDAAAKPSAGTTSAVWVFTPTDNAYAPVEGTAVITVNKAVPTVSAAPTVAGRIYNPFTTLKGDDLSVSDVAVTGVDGSTLEGTWGWQSADIVPTVDNSGYEAVFTPKDATNYETVSRTVTVTVEKATPYIAVLPTAAGITYGETLKDSALSGGTAQYGNGAGQAGDGAGNTAAVTGTFIWQEPSAKPVVADSNVTEYTVVFTPSDTANYNPVEAKATLTVNKAQNAPNMPGSTMDVSNRFEKVGDVSLPESWEWQASDQDTALEVGKPVSAVAVYAGADKGNYEKETVTVAITRSACDHVAGEILYTGAGEKAPACTEDGLGHRECTKCGSVVESGIVVKAPGHTGGTATCSKRAVCTRCGQPYGDTDGSVHGDTEVRGFEAAACTAGGYTGDTYCKDCGAKTKTGNATSALGHDYTSTVTKEPTTGSEGTRTYTCTRCGHSYTESIPKLPEETQGPSQTGGSGSDSSVSDSSGSTGAAPGQPFLKDSSGREGWDVVRAEAVKAAEAPAGGTVAVDMNGAASVPGSIFEAVRGKDVTLSFDMGGGITWSVNGKNVTAETAGSTDFSVKMGAGAIPAGLVEETASGLAHMELSLAHEGAFGFTATLTVRIISSGGGITAGSSGTAAGYTGMYANLFYYNPAQNSLEFICAGRVGEDGTVDLPFVHASDYTLILSASPMGDMQEPAAQARVKSVKLSKTLYTYDGKAKKPSVVAVDTEGRRISGKYYTVSYKNNKKVGKAAVTIKFKGGYSGTVKKTFTIRPAGTSIQKLAASSGGFTVKWKKKTAQTSGYQIQYSANAKFKGSSTRSVLVRKNSQVQKTVKNLKAQTKYYVRIRTYKTVKVNGKNTRIYSAWSKAVTVKTLPAAPENKTAASVRGAEFLIVEKEDGKR